MGSSSDACMEPLLCLMLALKQDLPFVNPLHTSTSNISSTTTMTTHAITLDQIEAARAAYREHLECVVAEDQGFIPQPRNENVDSFLKEIMIAREVTAEAVAAILREWLEGITVRNRIDGTLVMEYWISRAPSFAVGKRSRCLCEYADATGLNSETGGTYRLRLGGECKPGGVLDERRGTIENRLAMLLAVFNGKCY